MSSSWNETTMSGVVSEQRQQEQEQEQHNQQKEQQKQPKQEDELNEYVGRYPIEVAWPPTIVSSSSDEENSGSRPSLRTSPDLIYHRLLEHNVLPEIPVSVAETVENLNHFVQDLERTGCYHSVRVELGNSDSSSSSDSSSGGTQGQEKQQQLKIKLHEKNWYRLHMGGSVKTDGLFVPGGGGAGSGTHHEVAGGLLSLPAAEFEFSTGLRNVTGTCDTTHVRYTLDTHRLASYTISHERPLYSLLPNPDALLVLSKGSQYSCFTRFLWTTVDHQWIRGYQEYQRGFLARIANHHNTPLPERAGDVYWSWTYQALLRDVIPNTGTAPAVLKQAGPTLKHSVEAYFRNNGTRLDQAQLPTQGIDWNAKVELASGGDVAFVKTEANLAAHQHVPPASDNKTGLACHALFNVGYLHSLHATHFLPTISDRFFLGGPANFRGFLLGGVGPRATATTSTPSNNISHASGGDFYYTLTTMASLPLFQPTTTTTQTTMNDTTMGLFPMRAFCFGTVGTCVGSVGHVWNATRPNLGHTLKAVLYDSARVSVGVGLATQLLGSRLEVTYSIPLRYGPMDYRRNVQLGLSVQLDR